ncbi:MAG: hypothetical protein AB7P23_04415 [Amphiplicatus sp.]
MKIIALALIAMTAAGCATAYGPRYQAASGPGDLGYYDHRLDDNRYRIEYRSAEGGYAAEDYAMRRAAELTLAQDYDWFQVTRRSRAFGDDFFDRYDRTRYYRDDRDYRGRPRYGDGYDDAVAVLEIVMGYNPPPRGASIYDPRRVLDYRYDEPYSDGRPRY